MPMNPENPVFSLSKARLARFLDSLGNGSRDLFTNRHSVLRTRHSASPSLS
nr:hypothetical protein Q903MT_gene5130 [Picea sitchensis]